METRIVTLFDVTAPDADKILAEAARILRGGGLVAFPTETVYGLGADVFFSGAPEKIYEAKGRPSDNPLIVHIARIQDIGRIARMSAHEEERADRLSKAFWPGPLTMILRRDDCVPDRVTGGLDTVAVRLPSHPVARALIAAAGGFIAAPSANRSGSPSPTSARHVIEDLSGRVDMIIDGGDTEVGLESTIIDLTTREVTLLRQGMIERERLAEVLGEEVRLPAEGRQEDAPKAPGMKYRHYAPKAKVVLLPEDKKQAISDAECAGREAAAAGQRMGVIASTETAGNYKADVIITLGSEGDPDALAHNLYRALRDMDAQGVDIILAESFAHPAIRDRLTRAARG